MYHTHHSTTGDDIKELLAETSKVAVLGIEKRSNEHAYFGSFRVTVNRTDFDEAVKAEHWPEGWSIREYFVSRARREEEMATAAAAATASTENTEVPSIEHSMDNDAELVPMSQD